MNLGSPKRTPQTSVFFGVIPSFPAYRTSKKRDSWHRLAGEVLLAQPSTPELDANPVSPETEPKVQEKPSPELPQQPPVSGPRLVESRGVRGAT